MTSLAAFWSAVLSFGQGYRTYAAGAATVLTSLATVTGFISPTYGTVLAAAMIGMGQIFQRMATSDHALTVQEVAQDVSDLSADVKPVIDLIKQNTPVAQQTAIPTNGQK